MWHDDLADMDSSTMPLAQSRLVMVKRTGRKGRGVFAREDIRRGTIIERAPVIVVPVGEIFTLAGSTQLSNYAFIWGENTSALVLGYGSIYNHSFEPNATYYASGRQAQIFQAIRDICAGEEVTINYNGTPQSRAKVDFQVLK